MKITLIKSLIPILVLSDVALSQTWPEPPAIWREVTGIRYRSATNLQPEHQRPHMPTYRTTRDGRIAINPKTSQFTLIIPEKLTGPLLRTPASTKANNSFVIRHTSDFRLINPSTSAQYTTEDAHRAALFPLSTLIQQGKLPQNTLGSMGHVTLFDPTPADSTTGEITNPKNVNGKDVYTLTVVGAFVHDISDPNTNNADKMRIWSTNVEVTVSNPKKTNAVIEKIERIDDTLVGPAYPFTNAAGLEVSVADRGRLLVMRIAGGVPAASLNLPESKYNIVYSFTTSNPSFKVDPTKWTAIHPISHAPYDSRINTELGFALKPFRDAAGNEIPDNREFGATYPWIDPDAKNLFFTVIGDILKHRGKTFGTMVNGVYTPNPNINSESRFPNSPTFSGQIHSTAAEDFGPTRGVSFVRLWSNGKIVTIDNLNNDMDYQIDGNYFSRNVRLYQNVDSTWKNLVLGGGRVNGPDILGDVDNTGFIESMQNTYNYNQE